MLPTERYIANINGLLREVPAIDSSTGTADSGKIPGLNSQGVFDDSLMSRPPTPSSAGAADAGKIPYLNSEGRMDFTMFDPEVENFNLDLPAVGAILGSQMVSLLDDLGTLKTSVASSASFAGAAHALLRWMPPMPLLPRFSSRVRS